MQWLPSKIGKYEILKRLGGGEFSDVFLVHDTTLDTDKALKVLKETDPQAFLAQLEEAQILYKCQHKHIVKINSASIENVNGTPAVILDMEYIDKGSLQDYIEKNFVSVAEACRHIRDILFALEHIHNKGVLHKDIKPGNIMLGCNYSLLSDFGLATTIDTTKWPNGYMPHYAPEMFSRRKASILTDIYAVGMTFFRIVCNIKNNEWKAIKNENKQNNFKKAKQGKLINHIGYAPHIPQKIKRIINKACNPDPKKRFQSASEMGQSLDTLKFFINWKKKDGTHWRGEEGLTNNIYEIIYTQRRKHHIHIKKNDRKQHSYCKLFEFDKEAETYFYDFIVSKTFK